MKPPLSALCVCCRWNHRHVSYLNCVCFTDENRRQALHHQRSSRQLSALCVFYRWNYRHVSYLHCVCFTGGTTATSAICTVCVLQVEPDGKRYTINHRHVSYLHWDFHIRLSSLTGPQIYDVRYQGDRIAYELGLSEIAVFYSGDSPVPQFTDFVDSGALIGRSYRRFVNNQS